MLEAFQAQQTLFHGQRKHKKNFLRNFYFFITASISKVSVHKYLYHVQFSKNTFLCLYKIAKGLQNLI
jgi:hypothetical protein